MNIAVSACLLGSPCRFDGEARPCAAVKALRERHAIVPVCPETMAKLPRPRLPNEVVRESADGACGANAVLGGDANAGAGADDAGEGNGLGFRVVDSAGVDNTEAFVAGARLALERARQAGCDLAVLKSKSPSCGSGRIYDGTFSGTLTEGWGVAAALFRDAGIPVVDENAVERLADVCGGCPDDAALRRMTERC